MQGTVLTENDCIGSRSLPTDLLSLPPLEDYLYIAARTVTCNFDDKFLCGYTWDGWEVGYDNKLAVSIVIDGQTHTQSHAPQFDHTLGRYPGRLHHFPVRAR